MMPGVNYVIYGCSSARKTPGVLTMEENVISEIIQDKVIENNFKRQIKNQTLCTCPLFLPT